MASTSFSKSFGSVVGAYRLMVSPSFEIKNLVKFHLFKGMFDGNGHTINVNLNGGGEALALFHVIDGATIQNVKVTGTITSSNHRPATFAAFVEGTCKKERDTSGLLSLI